MESAWSPMESQWVSHGDAKGARWKTNGDPLGMEQESHGNPMGSRWQSNGNQFGIIVKRNKGTMETAMGIQWKILGNTQVDVMGSPRA